MNANIKNDFKGHFYALEMLLLTQFYCILWDQNVCLAIC